MANQCKRMSLLEKEWSFTLFMSYQKTCEILSKKFDFDEPVIYYTCVAEQLAHT